MNHVYAFDKTTLAISVVIAWGFLAQSLCGQTASFEKPPVDYQNAPVNDAVATLMKKLERGEVTLDHDDEHGYLKSILQLLDVPTSSQTLVFSKTSLQIQRITPKRPRAIYFNDDVYVGYVQNGEVIEIAATDARQGPTFYSIKQSRDIAPKFIRDKGQCIVCHASSRTQDVPGYLVRSVYPNRAGHAHFGRGTFTTNVASPFKNRWGGWYVTGTHGDMRHMGNTIYTEDFREDDFEKGANLKTLDGLISTAPYLTPHSDLVALMVLEHQTQMHNAITFANFETRRAVHQSQQMNELFKRDAGYQSETTQRRIKAAAENVVQHLFMCDEFQLTSPIAGTSGFASEFAARGTKDAKNRSLRDLDLNTQLFKYPCSYLVYSDSFEGLPNEVRTLILSRMIEILNGEDQTERFKHLTSESRTAIREILIDTHAEFAKAYKRDAANAGSDE